MQDDYEYLASLIDQAKDHSHLSKHTPTLPFWSNWTVAMISPNNQICCIKIPKNGSSFFDKKLVGWSNINSLPMSDDYNNTMHNFTVLRDPLDRWVTGMVTYLQGIHEIDEFSEIATTIKRSNFFNDRFKDYLISCTGKDMHTFSQLWFLSFFDLKKTYFFKLNDKLGYQVNKFLHIYDIDNHCTNHKINQINSNHVLYLCLKEILFDYKNITFKQKLEDMYKQDYDFINGINFYAR